MQLYNTLDRVGFLSKSYTFKFLFIVFLGIQIPLIGLIIYFATRTGPAASVLQTIIVALLLTLLATTITLFVLNKLLKPLLMAKNALVRYVESGESIKLPMKYKDEIGQLISAIQQMVHKLDKLNNEKTDLLSILSHDLRTPVSHILMLCELIQKESDIRHIKSYLPHIESSADNQLRLLDNILLSIRFTEQNMNIEEFTDTSLRKLVDRCISEMRIKITAKQIVAINGVQEGISVKINPRLFERVIHNLLLNAIKFSYKGQSVTISSSKYPGHTAILISDKGMGFDPAIAEKLFDRFGAYGRKGTADEPTEGLGLSLSRKIIEKHNGKIYGHSDGPNKGATFIIELPFE